MTIWNITASIASGLLGAMGFGGGGVLIIYLTQVLQYAQYKSQGINLMFFIPSAITALIVHIHNKMIEYKKIYPYILSAIPGVLAGLYLTTIIKGTFIAKIFGILLIIMGIKNFINKQEKK